jgi:hypothetical protein
MEKEKSKSKKKIKKNFPLSGYGKCPILLYLVSIKAHRQGASHLATCQLVKAHASQLSTNSHSLLNSSLNI